MEEDVLVQSYPPFIAPDNRCVNYSECLGAIRVKKTRECKRCYDRRLAKEKRAAKQQKPPVGFPTAEKVTIWHSSNGKEWNSEVEALREELDLAIISIKRLQAKLRGV